MVIGGNKMARNLASVKEIKEIHPIKNADKIERAVVDGFDVVVKKDEFKVGDLCVYCENDSILPVENPNFAFLEGKRIKIKRLRGIYSYGIAFPMSILDNPEQYNLNDNLTDILKVKKWEQLDKWYKHIDGRSFPSWIPKTDETRFQSILDVLQEYNGTVCMITEKLDGSSTTHWLDDEGEYHLCTRNLEITDKENFIYVDAIENNIPSLLSNLPKGSVVQGELIGPKIQGDKYQLHSREFRMFNLRVNNRFESASNTIKMLNEAGFKTVPVLDDNYILEADKDKLLELSIGKSVLNEKQEREGIVIRALANVFLENDDKGQFVDRRLSFKVINPKFELKLAEQ